MRAKDVPGGGWAVTQWGCDADGRESDAFVTRGNSRLRPRMALAWPCLRHPVTVRFGLSPYIGYPLVLLLSFPHCQVSHRRRSSSQDHHHLCNISYLFSKSLQASILSSASSSTQLIQYTPWPSSLLTASTPSTEPLAGLVSPLLSPQCPQHKHPPLHHFQTSHIQGV